MTVYSKELNRIMLIFSVMAIIFIPPQVIGGIMGMNVRVPFQDYEGSTPFVCVILVIVFFMSVIALIFKKLKFI